MYLYIHVLEREGWTPPTETDGGASLHSGSTIYFPSGTVPAPSIFFAGNIPAGGAAVVAHFYRKVLHVDGTVADRR